MADITVEKYDFSKRIEPVLSQHVKLKSADKMDAVPG